MSIGVREELPPVPRLMSSRMAQTVGRLSQLEVYNYSIFLYSCIAISLPRGMIQDIPLAP